MEKAMRINAKGYIARKGRLLYRRLRYCKGYGVHSPFVYNLITKVIEEPYPYYRFDDIELLRKRLLQREKEVAKVVRREAISPKYGALLFRLANYFQAGSILQVGPSMGLSALYLTSYKAGLKCISVENIPEYTAISRWVYGIGARTDIDLRTGDYARLIPEVLEEMGKVDLAFFNFRHEQSPDIRLVTKCMEHAGEGSLFVLDGIKANPSMRALWKEVCAHGKVTVCIDLFSMGIVFFNPKLHKRRYKVYY